MRDRECVEEGDPGIRGESHFRKEGSSGSALERLVSREVII